MVKFGSFKSLITAAALCAIFSFNAYASETGGITVKNPEEGHTYTAYLLFDATYDEDTDSIAYQASADQKEFYEALESDPFVFTAMAGSDYYAVTVSDDDSVSESDVTSFIQDLLYNGLKDSMLEDGIISDEGSVTAESTDSVTITPVPYGYYFVTSTMGALVGIDTADPDAVIEEKNAAPGLEKLVSNTEDGTYSSSNIIRKGKTEYFSITITTSAGAYNYVLHDAMDDGLVLDEESIVVTADGETLAEGTEYTVLYEADGLTDGCDFEITFTQSWLDTVAAGTEIVVTYSAKVGAYALVGTGGNYNTAELTYGDNSEWTTGTSKTTTSATRSSGSSSSGSSSGSTGSTAYSSGSSGSSGSGSDGTGTGSDGTSWDSPHSLPQTGQLNWPVPVLAVLGFISIFAGCLLVRGSDGSDGAMG